MLSASCMIRTIPKTANALYLTSSLMRRFSLKNGSQIKLIFGNSTLTTSVQSKKGEGDICFVPQWIANQLHLPFDSKMVKMTLEDLHLRLAPIFAIMTTSVQKSIQMPFGGRSKMMEAFLRAAGQEAYYYVFTPNDIDWGTKTIKGSFINPTPQGTTWVRKTCPFPDVIYNRIPNRKAEVAPKVVLAKNEFKKLGVKLFNPSFFNKWEIYNMIHDHSIAASHMPETHFAPSAQVIRTMLERYPFVYVKPSGGSLGIGIFKCFYRPKEGYFIQFRIGDQNALKRTHSFEAFMKYLSARTRTHSGYIIQQGIELITIDDRPVDFRVHLTKDRKNQWQVVGIGAKIAGKGSVTTHVRTGGVVTTPENVLQNIFGSSGGRMLELINKTSIDLAQAIEERNPGLLGEIGFDIGLDKKGKAWMFEANSKPGFSIFKHPSLHQSYKQSLRNIYEHSLYLADQHMKERA
jgi:hypothetical protein